MVNIAKHALEYHCDLNLSVVPIMPGTKRPPPKFPLSRYFHERASERDIRKWFRGVDMNIGGIVGDASDSLTVRDFDRQEAYQRWAGEHPRLAGCLPTSVTQRGTHVFCTADVNDVREFSRSGSTTIIGNDGELKAGSGYVLLPPSLHPSGHRYRWLNPPNDWPFIGDFLRAGLLPKNCRGTQEIVPALRDCPVLAGLTITQIIESTQPCGYGERHQRIFDFCRMLKATDLADAGQNELRAAFDRWFELALPRIRTKQYRTSWFAFLDGWNKVRRPFGATIAGIADRSAGTGIVKLASLCRELQIVAGDSPFFLDCRTAGTVLNVGKSTAARWLRDLCVDGSLSLTRKGDRIKRLASEYRFQEME